MVESSRSKITDYISGKLIPNTKEERDAIQPFSKKLVEFYRYPKSFIQTRPQYGVKARPSDERKSYPVDIAVFSSENHNEDSIQIVIEGKSKERKTGIGQLEDYMRLSRATMGVWHNGTETVYLRKIEQKGKILFPEIRDIPKFGERLEDIGQYKRKDLVTPRTLINDFKTIRNYLAGNAKGITTDVRLAPEVINLILTKLYDETKTKPGEKVMFRAGQNESDQEILERIVQRFTETKEQYDDVFDTSDQIKLDVKSVAHIVSLLQGYSLIDAERDVVGEAFEVFIGPTLRGDKGQFFTPRNVVKTVIEIIDPDTTENVIDPACGSGGFLVECLKYFHNKIEQEGKELEWSEKIIEKEKIEKVTKHIRGIEADEFLSKVAKAYMIILGDGKSGIKCDDSLAVPKNWNADTKDKIKMGTFDVVITNPPFGSKIHIEDEEKLAQFELGYNWKEDGDGIFVKDSIRETQAPQILFIDRCLDLLKDGGRMGIVLPDGVLSNTTYEYIRHSLKSRTEIIGMVDLPADTFQPSTNTKTHLLFLRKTSKPNQIDMFMSYAKTCGHDKRGNPTSNDDVKKIPKHLKKLLNGETESSRLGIMVDPNDIKNNILLPKYYNPEHVQELQEYANNGFDLVSIGELRDSGDLSIGTGNSIDSETYGTGNIPFIRTTDIGNLEIQIDSTQCTSEAMYQKYSKRQNIRADDLLVVRDGTYLIGKAAMITDLDTKIIIQGHFLHIVVKPTSKISSHLLLALLNMEIVQKQIESKTFTQSNLSTLGNRLFEVILPVPTDESLRKKIEDTMKKSITRKRDAKADLLDFDMEIKKECLMGLKNRAALGNL